MLIYQPNNSWFLITISSEIEFCCCWYFSLGCIASADHFPKRLSSYLKVSESRSEREDLAGLILINTESLHQSICSNAILWKLVH
jgi:hypothetical protein